MRVTVHCALTLSLLCCVISCMSAVAWGQTTVKASPDLWDAVQATPSRTELEVQLDDGQQLRGRLLTATAQMLRLSRSNEITEVHRDRVLKIYELSPKPDELRKMLRNAGALSGAAAGLEIGKNKEAGFLLIPVLGGTFGAFGGYALANRLRTRILIYDANPRQVMASPVSKSDEPQALTRRRTIATAEAGSTNRLQSQALRVPY